VAHLVPRSRSTSLPGRASQRQRGRDHLAEDAAWPARGRRSAWTQAASVPSKATPPPTTRSSSSPTGPAAPWWGQGRQLQRLLRQPCARGGPGGHDAAAAAAAL